MTTRGGARTPTLGAIAIFKMVKALLSLGVAAGAFGLLDPSVADAAQRWVVEVASVYDERIVERVISFFTGLTPRHLQVIGSAALVYATLFVVEGIGLWRGKRWAEYMTVGITASLIPLEIYEVARRLTFIRVGALVANLAIVAYLVYEIRKGAAEHARQSASKRSIGAASDAGSSLGA